MVEINNEIPRTHHVANCRWTSEKMTKLEDFVLFYCLKVVRDNLLYTEGARGPVEFSNGPPLIMSSHHIKTITSSTQDDFEFLHIRTPCVQNHGRNRNSHCCRYPAGPTQGLMDKSLLFSLVKLHHPKLIVIPSQYNWNPSFEIFDNNLATYGSSLFSIQYQNAFLGGSYFLK